MSKSKEVKASSKWWCDTCGGKEEMTHKEIMAHLKEKHSIEPKGLKCWKRMKCHMDGDTWFSSEYEVTIETPDSKVTLTNATMNPRAKDDIMRFA